MKTVKTIISVLFYFAFLTGCVSSPFDEPGIASINKRTGFFRVKETLTSGEIVEYKKLNLSSYRRLLVLGLTHSPNYKEEGLFLTQAIRNLNIFGNVETAENLESFLSQHKLKHPFNFADGCDLILLHQLQKIYGDFLVLEVASYYPWGTIFRVVDPQNGDVLFEVDREPQSRPKTSVREFYYPALNALKTWVIENTR